MISFRLCREIMGNGIVKEISTQSTLVSFPDPPTKNGGRVWEMGLYVCVSPHEFVQSQSRALITILREASHSCESGQASKCAVKNVMEQAIAFALAQLGYQKL